MSCKNPLWRINWKKLSWAFPSEFEKRVSKGGIILSKQEYEYYASKSPILRDLIQQTACGQCAECRLAKSRDWANRCMIEAKQYEFNCFVTLTYDDAHLSFAEHCDVDTGEVDIRPVLVKRDLQLFMKRLRKKLPDIGYDFVRFFAAGEYGDQGGRPHYHVILFNCEFPDLKFAGYSDVDPSKPMFTSKILDELWSNGACMIAELSWETVAYVARYTMKKITGKKRKLRDEQLSSPWQDEFCLMSRRPGIGRAYYDENKLKIYQNDEMFIKQGGEIRAVKPAKYYDRLMKEEQPKLIENLKLDRLRALKNAERVELSKTDLTQDEYAEMKNNRLEERITALKRK